MRREKKSKWQPDGNNKIRNRQEQNLQRALSLFIRLIRFYWIVSPSLIAGRKETRVALGIHRVSITALAYLRLVARLGRMLIYTCLLSIARWVKVGTESRLIKRHPTAALFIDCVGDRLASLYSQLCSLFCHFDVEFLIFREIAKIEIIDRRVTYRSWKLLRYISENCDIKIFLWNKTSNANLYFFLHFIFYLISDF